LKFDTLSVCSKLFYPITSHHIPSHPITSHHIPSPLPHFSPPSIDNATRTTEWFGGFPYVKRVVSETEQAKSQRVTLECIADFRLSIMKEGDVVVLDPTDFESTKIKGSILPIVQALLLTMKEGDKVEAIAPKELAYGDCDVYVEICVKKIHYYTGVTFVLPQTN